MATDGDGTPSRPYLIANYFIAPTNGPGVEIRNTTKYFLLRNATVDGSSSSGYSGFSFSNVTHGIIENNTARHWSEGFILDASDHNTLTGNTATNNSISGFVLGSSRNNTVTGNTASYNIYNGFILASSNTNTLISNTASASGYYGFHLDMSDHNILTGNTASHNGKNGFFLDMTDHNTLIGNTPQNNNWGFMLDGSENNLLFWNSIRQNGNHAYSDQANTWHNGTHGNYWSEYEGTDSNNDDIGDTPYAISGEGDNEDSYPLMVDPGPTVLIVPHSGPTSSSETITGSASSPGWSFLALVAALALIGVAALALLGAVALTVLSAIRQARRKE
ncbi:MAG: right-handed parallel beta-helix repeat-containing protein [Candidatus Hodarchaeales archaeon]